MTLNERTRVAVQRWGAVFTGLLAASLLAGCASREPAPEAAPGTKAPVLLKSVDLRLPLDTYLFSPSEQQRMEEARAALDTTCMRRLGLDYDPGPVGPPLGPRSLMDRRYGVTDEAEAASDGYHLGDRDPRTRTAPTREPLTDAENSALLGSSQGASAGDGASLPDGRTVPAGGCVGESTKALAGGGQLGPTDPVRKANAETFKSSMADARVVKVFGAWSRCMEKRGHAYADPFAAMSESRFQGAEPAPDEPEVAVADVACKKRTNLVGTWFAVETAQQEKLIARNRSTFDDALKSKKEQLSRAAEALGNSR
ncbi:MULTISPECIES: hypothetical protein [Streptomyces]|uniref:Lipoprotein n=1 Tax=Streptomyces flavovirens TaxID=52258 RepID=A0ABV8NGR3_9ACTN|nr:hypothetical protein [Streptomyces sp. MBT51]MBK3591768.1 hypothetical protein [Streptomyces sp. MBT51]